MAFASSRAKATALGATALLLSAPPLCHYHVNRPHTQRQYLARALRPRRTRHGSAPSCEMGDVLATRAALAQQPHLPLLVVGQQGLGERGLRAALAECGALSGCIDVSSNPGSPSLSRIARAVSAWVDIMSSPAPQCNEAMLHAGNAHWQDVVLQCGADVYATLAALLAPDTDIGTASPTSADTTSRAVLQHALDRITAAMEDVRAEAEQAGQAEQAEQAEQAGKVEKVAQVELAELDMGASPLTTSDDGSSLEDQGAKARVETSATHSTESSLREHAHACLWLGGLDSQCLPRAFAAGGGGGNDGGDSEAHAMEATDLLTLLEWAQGVAEAGLGHVVVATRDTSMPRRLAAIEIVQAKAASPREEPKPLFTALALTQMAQSPPASTGLFGSESVESVESRVASDARAQLHLACKCSGVGGDQGADSDSNGDRDMGAVHELLRHAGARFCDWCDVLNKAKETMDSGAALDAHAASTAAGLWRACVRDRLYHAMLRGLTGSCSDGATTATDTLGDEQQQRMRRDQRERLVWSGHHLWRALELVCSSGALAKEAQLGLQLPRAQDAAHGLAAKEEGGGGALARNTNDSRTCPLAVLQADMGAAGSAALESLLSAGWLELRLTRAAPPGRPSASLPEVKIGNGATDEAADVLLGTGATIIGDSHVAVGCTPLVQAAFLEIARSADAYDDALRASGDAAAYHTHTVSGIAPDLEQCDTGGKRSEAGSQSPRFAAALRARVEVEIEQEELDAELELLEQDRADCAREYASLQALKQHFTAPRLQELELEERLRVQLEIQRRERTADGRASEMERRCSRIQTVRDELTQAAEILEAELQSCGASPP